jgi:hypothetical protein
VSNNNPFGACPNLIDGQWHTIAFTYDGAGSQSLYIDNAFVETVALSDYYGGRYYTEGDENGLGGGLYNSDSYYYHLFENKFIGDLKDIAFYDYALTASQATSDSITE